MIGVAAIIAGLAGLANAEFPTPEQAGFHHCMLLYDAQARDAGGMMPHVTHIGAGGAPDQWLFDAFLFIAQTPGPSSGQSYMTGATDREDWEALLDGWFAPGYGYHALQEAVDKAEETLGPIPEPLRMVITIPYPSPAQTDFGDVDGDGIGEDLTKDADFERALSWYLDEAISRFDEATLPDLALWGFYWIWEGVSGRDASNIARTSGLVHERGRRLLWIPWFRASGWERWRELGFDVALMQPNYAFLTYHRDGVRNDRLIETAALAEAHGLGVEMETGYAPDSNPRVREIFRDYMAFGASEISGYQHAATAYFQSLNVFPNLLRATDPDARRTYDQIAAYVRGDVIPRPGWLREAMAARDGEEIPQLVDGRFVTESESSEGIVGVIGPETVFTVRLPEPRDVSSFEVSVLRDATASWIGTLHVQVLAADGTVTSSAWRRAIVEPAADGAFKTVLALPLGAEAVSALRVRVLPMPGQGPLQVDEFSVTVPSSSGIGEHLAIGKAYSIEPQTRQQYPDRGGQLTDGAAATRGWQEGKSVGWQGEREVSVTLDLGKLVEIEKCVVHCDGGGMGAVYFPTEVAADLRVEASAGGVEAVGRGAPPAAPAATVCASGGEFVVDWAEDPEAHETATSGHLELAPREAPVTARYVMIRFTPRAWLMVSEIEVYAGGLNVAEGAAYRWLPSPTAHADVLYGDDGRILVDGHVAGGLAADAVCGWQPPETPSVTIDLGREQRLTAVTVHALGGGRYAVFTPGRIAVELSSDGADYVEAASVEASDPDDDTCRDVPIAIALPEDARGRYVRLKFSGLRGWLLLSEVAVR